MILVDTSIWVDHLGRSGETTLQALLEEGQVLTHPFIIGELAMGNLSKREMVLESLMVLPSAKLVAMDEALHLLHQAQLYGMGIGYIDLHLLSSTRLTQGTSLWTRDKRLLQACVKAGVQTFVPSSQ
ncbi:PIN domain-containing protein [Alcaligenaceae bacterium]|nr:PIN domain-containing protein [Alcaligenaceae bacterium]